MSIHLVTGASTGMGFATAHALAERGESVVIVARRDEALQALAGEHPGLIEPVAADVADSADLRRILDRVGGRPLASIVHGAATTVPTQPWVELDPSELAHHFHVHVAAPIALTAALLRSGTVERSVIFDSYSAATPRDGWGAYSILKSAAQMAMRSAALELEATAIFRVYPGAVATPLLDRILGSGPEVAAAEFYRDLRDQGLVSTPQEIGNQLAELLLTPLGADRSGEFVHHIGHSISQT